MSIWKSGSPIAILALLFLVVPEYVHAQNCTGYNVSTTECAACCSKCCTAKYPNYDTNPTQYAKWKECIKSCQQGDASPRKIRIVNVAL